jgi:hypothetical protein
MTAAVVEVKRAAMAPGGVMPVTKVDLPPSSGQSRSPEPRIAYRSFPQAIQFSMADRLAGS